MPIKHDIVTFGAIPISAPRPAIYHRLGYRDDATQLTEQQQSLVDDYIKQAMSLLRLRAVFRRLSVIENDTTKISCGDGVVFESRHVATMLHGCYEVVFMAATGGREIVEQIRKQSQGRDVMQAVVFDATASETVDAALDWLMSYIRNQLLRENKQLLAKRFSAGYGDFALSNQLVFYNELELSKLDIALTNDYVLLPEKSVTAVTGIQDMG